MEIIGRFFKEPAGSFFLFGPRGTGKSTWLRQRFPKALWVDMLQPDVHRAFLARPERLRDLVLGSEGQMVVVDEVQKAPELLDVVHSLIDSTETVFALTGSSARKLRRTGVDLLAGRAVLRTMHPFMAAELGAAFDLQRGLRDGMLPLVWGSPDGPDALRAYASLYLGEEVQAEGLVRNIGHFSRFLETISFAHGGMLNISNLARECAVGRKTAEGYVEILEDLLLAFRLPVFRRRAGRQVTATPKLYLFDSGVFRSLRPTGPLDRPEEIDGSALEGLVAQHLRAWVELTPAEHSLYFWRTPSGTEVDFIIYGEKGLWAFEVKNTASVRGSDLKGLRAFCKDYPEGEPIYLYRGAERLRIDGVLCLPVDEFLRQLTPGRPPWAG